MSHDIWFLILILGGVYAAAVLHERWSDKSRWHLATIRGKVKDIDGSDIGGSVMQRRLPSGEMQYRRETTEEFCDRW